MLPTPSDRVFCSGHELARRRAVCGAIALALAACAPVPAPVGQPQSGASPTADEYAVYSAVLDSVYTTFKDAYVVVDRTHGPLSTPRGEWVRRLLEPTSTISTELLDAYSARNVDAAELSAAGFHTTLPVVLVPLETTGVEGERVVQFSRVGFTADGSEALVHVLFSCGERCGGGGGMRLSRVSGGWRIEEEVPTVRF